MQAKHLLSIALLAVSVKAEAASSGEVVILNKDTYDSFLAENKVTLIEYFAPWCGHCKRLAPEFEKAAAILKDNDIKIATVDCTENEEICTKIGIRGYPTLKVYSNGQEQEYEGDRTAASIVSTMKKALLPTISKLSLSELENFNKEDDYFIVSVGLDQPTAEKFAKFAESERLKVASVEPKIGSNEIELSIVNKFKSNNAVKDGELSSGIYMIKKFDDGFAQFPNATYEVEDLSKWARLESIPIVAEVGPHNYGSYLAAGLPMAYLFYKSEDMRNQYASMFETLMKPYKGKFTAVFIDAEKFHAHAKALTLPDDKWPGFVIHDMDRDLKYPFLERGDFNADNLTKFVAGIADGSIEPTYRSQEVPKSDDAAVKTAVFKNFQSLVMDTKKDVLLKIYAPWCGACKRLAPVYEELAKLYAPHSDKIIIAKLDGTENDLPKEAAIKLTKFPTFILFKAETNEQVEMESPLSSVDGFVKFLKENCKNQIDIAYEPKDIEAPKMPETGSDDSKDEL